MSTPRMSRTACTAHFAALAILAPAGFAGGEQPTWSIAAAQEEDERAEEARGPVELKLFWDRGLRFRDQTGEFDLFVGGRLEADFALHSAATAIEQDPTKGRFVDGAEFRRARLHLGGRMYDNIRFMFEYDFGDNAPGNSTEFRDVFVAYDNAIGDATFQVGHFEEPFSFEQIMNQNDFTFMERSMSNVFAPVRNIGAMLSGTAKEDELTWALGIFRDSNDFGDDNDGSGDGEYAITGRITNAPRRNGDDSELVHIGAAVSLRNAPNNQVSYATRPEDNLAPIIVDTNPGALPPIMADEQILIGLEAAMIQGPWSFLAEARRVDINRDDATDPDFNGYYIYGSYMLTGEVRQYDRRLGVFGGITPLQNWREGDGMGAWELAVRFSQVDLEDGDINGGRAGSVTGALNWYMNPNARVMLNIIKGHVEDDNIIGVTSGDGEYRAALLRFQVNV